MLLYIALFARVGAARGKYNVPAPATTGHPAFERAFRIQANTAEQLLIFLPSLWLFSFYIAPLWASLLGLVWIAGRIVYAISYNRDPQRRTFGFIVAFVANAVLLLGALIAAGWHIFQGGL